LIYTRRQKGRIFVTLLIQKDIMKRLLIFLPVFILLIACKKTKQNNGGSTPIPPPVITNGLPAALQRGVNLSNWFNDYSDPAQYTTRFTGASFQQIKTLGFSYVRIPIGNTILYNSANPSQLNAVNLQKVDNGIKAAIDAGLGVTINIHPWKEDMDSTLAADPATVDKVAAYWKAMAAYFKKYPADRLFFEVYNEPHASSAGLTTKPKTWWTPVQEKLVQAIRQETPDHFIIVGGESWNSIDGLIALPAYNITKLIYNFHFYDPFIFTHQGATWVGWAPALLGRDIPYPSSPEGVAPLVAAATNAELKNNLQWYGSQRYNVDTLDKWILRAVNWSEQNKVILICNEFGSYKNYAPRQSRLSYIKDMRTVLEKYKIGWAMWEYDEGFGLIDYPGGGRNNPVINNEIASALGLR
jgi:endoglucanase